MTINNSLIEDTDTFLIETHNRDLARELEMNMPNWEIVCHCDVLDEVGKVVRLSARTKDMANNATLLFQYEDTPPTLTYEIITEKLEKIMENPTLSECYPALQKRFNDDNINKRFVLYQKAILNTFLKEYTIATNKIKLENELNNKERSKPKGTKI